MNKIRTWNPYREMQDLQNRVLHVLQGSDSHTREAIDAAEWTPVVDITEDADEYLIKAELPEVGRDDVKVTVENGQLTLRGERRSLKEEEGRKFHRVERAHGSFLRRFQLPDNADFENVKAGFKEGVLSIHIGKQVAAKPRQIDVQVD